MECSNAPPIEGTRFFDSLQSDPDWRRHYRAGGGNCEGIKPRVYLPTDPPPLPGELYTVGGRLSVAPHTAVSDNDHGTLPVFDDCEG